MSNLNEWPLGLIDVMTSDVIFVGTLAEICALNRAADDAILSQEVSQNTAKYPDTDDSKATQ